jgi:hypothetical protein
LQQLVDLLDGVQCHRSGSEIAGGEEFGIALESREPSLKYVWVMTIRLHDELVRITGLYSDSWVMGLGRPLHLNCEPLKLIPLAACTQR